MHFHAQLERDISVQCEQLANEEFNQSKSLLLTQASNNSRYAGKENYEYQNMNFSLNLLAYACLSIFIEEYLMNSMQFLIAKCHIC